MTTPVSSNGRTRDFESLNRGSNPRAGTKEPPADSAPPPGSFGWIRLALLVLFVVGVVAAFVFGDVDRFEPARLRADLLAMGVWAPVALLGIFWFVQPFILSSHALILAATLVWGPVETFLIGWFGTIGSGVTSYVFARFVARDWVQRRMPKRLHKFDRGLEEHGLRTVVVLRVLFFTTHPVQMMLGASRVRFWPFLIGSAIGFVPGVLLDVVIGRSVLTWIVDRVFA